MPSMPLLRRGIMALSFLSQAMLPTLAQSNDPVIMHINGQPITRSEFEYSYNKNNSEGVIDRKGVAEYVPLFVDYKLKVEAAKDARIDTTATFLNEFATYRDQQIRPAMITDADVEDEARKIYSETQKQIDNNGGLVKVAHILILVPRNANDSLRDAAKARIDSIYSALKKGANFAEMASKHSQDKESAKNGGELPLIAKGQTLKEFEEKAWALKDGETSEPIKTAVGWHILLKKESRKFHDYQSQRDAIMKFIEARGLRERIIDKKLDSLAKKQDTTPEKILEAKRKELEQKDSNLKYLIQEYHDGLLLYEIANSMVWEKARNDSAGQEKYFQAHRKQYVWKDARFKGVAYRARHKEDIQKVKDALKDKPFEEWADILRTTFNNDSILRIRAEKGIFTQGMNAIVDKQVFGKDTTVTAMKDFPHVDVYGRKLAAPESTEDIRQQVIADYQSDLEKQWCKALRKRYKVSIDKKVVATVNKH